MGESRGPILLANTLVFGIAAVLIVALRISFRLSRRWIDGSDWCIGTALISSLCQEAFNAACVTLWGYGQHKADLPQSIAHSTMPLKLYWLKQIFFKVTTLSTKLSLCIVYLKVFKRANSRIIRWTRATNYGTAFIVVIYYSIACFLSIFQCTPVSKAWKTMKVGTCIDMSAFRYSTASVNIITSVLVIITPLPALFLMRQRGGSEVTQLMGLILLGVVHTGCTIARLVLMVYPDPATKIDPQWANTPSNTLAIVEMDIGIIAASLVVMRPCFQALYDVIIGRPSKAKSAGYTPSGNVSGSGYGSRTESSRTRAIRESRDTRKIMRTMDMELTSASREELM